MTDPDPLAQEADALEALKPVHDWVDAPANYDNTASFAWAGGYDKGFEEFKARAMPLIRALRERNEAQARIIGAFDVENPANALKQAQARLESLEAEVELLKERTVFESDPTPSEIAARVEQKRREAGIPKGG